MISIILYIFGAICIFYDLLLIIINPGTFLDNLTAFSHIWLVLGGYHIFLGIYRNKTGHSFWKIWKTWCKRLFVVLISFAGIFSIISLCYIYSPEITDTDESAEYLILLGGGIDKNGKLPASVQKRVDKAAEYLLIHSETICVVTGGTLKWLPFAEAPKIKMELVSRGINQEKILVEDQSLDTIQNFQYSTSVIADYENCSVQEVLEKPIVVVTSFYHLKRAEILANRMGFKKIKGLPAKTAPYVIVHSYVREICAYLKLFSRILLTGEPSEMKELIYPQL